MNTATVRIDPFGEASGWQVRSVEKIRSPAKPARPDANGYVLVVPDFLGGEPSEHDREVVSAAAELAARLGASVAMLAPAGLAEREVFPIDHLIPCPDALYSDDYLPESWLSVIAATLSQLNAFHVLFPERPLSGGDKGRRLAAHLRESAATYVFSLDGDDVVRADTGRAMEQRFRAPRILMLEEGTTQPVAGPDREVVLVPLSFEIKAEAIVNQGTYFKDTKSLTLAEADFILAAGQGVTDWTRFHALAEQLYAVEGATRAVCDRGDLPRSRQVGASGTIVSCDCYIALGISGATQHLQGIAGCRHVIAVNTDPYAPIMKRADLAIVSDVQELMAALLDKVSTRHDRA